MSGGLEDTVAFTESAVVNTPGTSQSNEVLVSIPSAIPIANRLTSPAPGLPAQAVPSVIPSVRDSTSPVSRMNHARVVSYD